MTRTCQVLLEGTYNGIFEPWRHYIPVKRDYSNIDEVLRALQDEKPVDRISEQAYQDIVASGKWSYRRFVREGLWREPGDGDLPLAGVMALFASADIWCVAEVDAPHRATPQESLAASFDFMSRWAAPVAPAT